MKYCHKIISKLQSIKPIRQLDALQIQLPPHLLNMKPQIQPSPPSSSLTTYRKLFCQYFLNDTISCGLVLSSIIHIVVLVLSIGNFQQAYPSLYIILIVILFATIRIAIIHKSQSKSVQSGKSCLLSRQVDQMGAMMGTWGLIAVGITLIVMMAREIHLKVTTNTQTTPISVMIQLIKIIQIGFIVLYMSVIDIFEICPVLYILLRGQELGKGKMEVKDEEALLRAYEVNNVIFHGQAMGLQRYRDTVNQILGMGIKVRIITTQGIEEAIKYAKSINVLPPGYEASATRDAVISGDKFMEQQPIEDQKLSALCNKACVIAQCQPKQALKILTLLEENSNPCLLMATDPSGIPCLQKSTLGLTLKSCSPGVHQASDVILSDNDPSPIPQVLAVGREMGMLMDCCGPVVGTGAIVGVLAIGVLMWVCQLELGAAVWVMFVLANLQYACVWALAQANIRWSTLDNKQIMVRNQLEKNTFKMVLVQFLILLIQLKLILHLQNQPQAQLSRQYLSLTVHYLIISQVIFTILTIITKTSKLPALKKILTNRKAIFSTLFIGSFMEFILFVNSSYIQDSNPQEKGFYVETFSVDQILVLLINVAIVFAFFW